MEMHRILQSYRPLMVILLTGCAASGAQDTEQWRVSFDVVPHESGSCIVRFTAGEDVELTNRGLQVRGPQ